VNVAFFSYIGERELRDDQSWTGREEIQTLPSGAMSGRLVCGML